MIATSLYNTVHFEIFSFLDLPTNYQLRRVNKYFLEQGKAFFKGDFSSLIVKLQIRKSTNLQSKHVRNFIFLSQEIYEMEEGARLLHIVRGFFEQSCLQLRSLNLDSFMSVSRDGLTLESLSDEDLALIGKNCPHLTSLHLGSHFKLTDGGVNRLMTQCTQLVAFDFTNCQLSANAFHAIQERNIVEAHLTTRLMAREQSGEVVINTEWLTHTQQLEKFSIRDNGVKGVDQDFLIFYGSSLETNFQDWTLNFFDRCASLRDVDLSGIGSWLNDAIVTKLVAKSPFLTSLNLADQHLMTDLSIEEIGGHCRELTHLNLAASTNITKDAIIRILSSCPLLQKLDIRCIPLDCALLFNQLLDVSVLTLRSLLVTPIDERIIDRIHEKFSQLVLITD